MSASLHGPYLAVDGTVLPSQVRTRVHRLPGERARVVVVTPDDVGMELTPQEARVLARQLLAFAQFAKESP